MAPPTAFYASQGIGSDVEGPGYRTVHRENVTGNDVLEDLVAELGMVQMWMMEIQQDLSLLAHNTIVQWNIPTGRVHKQY